jgi:hypothetical protein
LGEIAAWKAFIMASCRRLAKPPSAHLGKNLSLILAILLCVNSCGHAAPCTPIAATLCVGVDDAANVWVNGQCVASCPAPPSGDFNYIPSHSTQPVQCIPVSLALLSADGDNCIAVELINTAPVQVWATWALTISCSGGGISTLTSDAAYDAYHDPTGAAPPPPNAGKAWYDPYYDEPSPWGAAVSVSAAVYGKVATDPLSGLPLVPQSWDAAADGPGPDVVYFRQNGPTPTATPTPPWTATLSPTDSLSPTASDSPTQTLTFTGSPTASPSCTITLTATITPTFSVTPTYSVTPSISPTFTPFNGDGAFKLLGLYPNPFQDQLQVGYALQAPGQVRMTVYNVAGEAVAQRSQDGSVGAGTLVWRGDNDHGARCATGVYLLHVQLLDPGPGGGAWARAVLLR